MSLYALMPGPSPSSSSAVGNDLVQTFNKQSPSFAEEERKAKQAAAEKLVIVDMSKMNKSGMPRTDSLSTISRDGIESDVASQLSGAGSDNSSFAATAKNLYAVDYKKEVAHQWIIRVEEAMMNYRNLVKPPRSTGRANVTRRPTDSRLCRRKGGNSKASTFDLDPTEKAVEFRFLISYAGRTYCTKRSLLQCAQLRENLLEEQQWNQDHSYNMSLRTRSDNSSKLDGSGGDFSSISPCSSDHDDSHHDQHHHQEPEAMIPEIPRIGDSLFCAPGGGFSQMSGMLDAYTLALEKWFKEVLVAVSDENPILHDFLWEPLDCTCNRDTLHARLTTLGDIKEQSHHNALRRDSAISIGELSFAEDDLEEER